MIDTVQPSWFKCDCGCGLAVAQPQTAWPDACPACRHSIQAHTRHDLLTCLWDTAERRIAT